MPLIPYASSQRAENGTGIYGGALGGVNGSDHAVTGSHDLVSALFAADFKVHAHAQHGKTVVSARMLFFHDQGIAYKNVHFSTAFLTTLYYTTNAQGLQLERRQDFLYNKVQNEDADL